MFRQFFNSLKTHSTPTLRKIEKKLKKSAKELDNEFFTWYIQPVTTPNKTMSYTQYLTATPSRTGNNTLFLRHFYSLRLWMKETWEKEYGEGSFEHIQNVGRFFFTAPIIDDLLNRCEEICAAHRKYGRSLNRQDIQIAHKLLPDEYRYWTPKACADDYNSDYFQNVKNLKNFLKKNHNKAITWEQD